MEVLLLHNPLNIAAIDNEGLIDPTPATFWIPLTTVGSITGNVSVRDSHGNCSTLANVTLVLFSSNGTEIAQEQCLQMQMVITDLMYHQGTTMDSRSTTKWIL